MSKKHTDTDWEDLPDYVQDAKFLKLGLDVDPDNWPRDPQAYTPTDKFRHRFNRFGEMIEGNIVEDAIKYGTLYSAMKGAVAFVNDMGGVAYYVIVTREPTYPKQKLLRNDEISLVDLDDDDDYIYEALSLWPYVYNWDKAWASGKWSTKQLERIQELAKEDPEEKINFKEK